MAIDSEPDQRPPSTVESLTINAVGFESDDVANHVANCIFSIVQEIGRYIDASTLDGLTIAVDYDLALKDIDKGVPNLKPETRTNDDELVGVAKCITVLRGESIKSHIVLDANAFWYLKDASFTNDQVMSATSIIAHEMAHVEDYANMNAKFPGILLDTTYTNFYDCYLREFSEAFWAEYAACRISAPFEVDGAQFSDALATRLKAAAHGATESINKYRFHGDLTNFFAEVGLFVLEPLRMASYLFGYLDGCSQEKLVDPVDHIPTDDKRYLTSISDLVFSLRELWDSRNDWPSHDEIHKAGIISFRLLAEFGVIVTREDGDGAYIDVPFSPSEGLSLNSIAEKLSVTNNDRSMQEPSPSSSP